MFTRMAGKYAAIERTRRWYLGFGALVFLVFSCVIALLFLHQVRQAGETFAEYTREEIVDIKKEFLKNHVDNTIEFIEERRSRYSQTLEGDSPEAVRKLVETDLRQKMYNDIYFDDAYMWVNEVLDYEGGDGYAIRLIHANLKDTEGQSLSTDMEDIAGNRPYLEELEGVKAEGELFFTYNFKKLGSDEIGEKITYAKLYPEYGWIVAMGVYYDTIDAYYQQIREDSRREIAGYVAVLFGAGILTMAAGYLAFLVLEKRYYNRSNQQLRKELDTDALTGAGSRRAGMAQLRKSYEAFSRGAGSLAVLVLDLDDFKTLNDTYGHDAGDRVLQEAVVRIQACIRESDRLFRWGGEEFLILSSAMAPSGIGLFMGKIIAAVKEATVDAGGERIGVSVSIGASFFKEEDAGCSEAVKRADEALYESKRNGKSRGTVKV